MLARNEALDIFAGPSADGSGKPGLFDNVQRLTPNSTIQFVEIELKTSEFSSIRRHFVEDRFEDEAGPRTVLLPVDNLQTLDGLPFHPVTLEPVALDRWLTISGVDGLEPFVGRWVPLPFHRFKGRDIAGRPILDDGPLNWVRAFVCDPGSMLLEADTIKVVLAFDTAPARSSRLDSSPYLAPSLEDVSLSSTFVLQDDPIALGNFLGEEWVEAWLDEACRNWRTGSTTVGLGASPGDRSRPAAAGSVLDHLARYLVFLKILSASASLPQIRFIDTVSASWAAEEVAVNLVLDISNLMTVALLQEVDPSKREQLLGNTRMLGVRELSNPGAVHVDPLLTEVEFDEPPFGSASLSRRSGRTDAFSWPSLTRIGREARRLSLRGSATPGVTGLSRLKSRLTDVAPSQGPWRVGREQGDGAKLGPMVAGETMANYREDGTLLKGGVPALRPMFSQSSLLGLFVGELLLHALSEINAPCRNSVHPRREQVRRIHRIVVTTAAGMPVEERQLLLERVTDAVEAIWRGLGWQEAGDSGKPAMPRIALGLHADLGAQLIYLHEEISDKFHGNVKDFIDISRRQKHDRAMTPALRMASVNFGSQHANIAVVDYELGQSGTLYPARTMAERSPVAGDAVVEELARKFILSAIETAMWRAGARNATALMRDAFAEKSVEPSRFGPHFRQRMQHRVIQPAATALLEAYIAMPSAVSGGLLEIDLAGLVQAGEGRLAPLDAELERIAIEQGAIQFSLAATRLIIGKRDLSIAIRVTIAPLIEHIARMTHVLECDALLICGFLARVPDVEDALISLLPMAPHRIVNLASRGNSLFQFQQRSNDASAALMGAAGACLLSGNGHQAGSFAHFTAPQEMTASLSELTSTTTGIADNSANPFAGRSR